MSPTVRLPLQQRFSLLHLDTHSSQQQTTTMDPLIRVLPAAPELDSYAALPSTETPATFFPDKPVLHFHATHLDVLSFPEETSSHTSLFGSFFSTSTQLPNGNVPSSPDRLASSTLQDVTAFVGTDGLILTHGTAGTLLVPLQAVAVHATQRLRVVEGGFALDPGRPGSSALAAGERGSMVHAVYLLLDPHPVQRGAGGEPQEEDDELVTLYLVPRGNDSDAQGIFDALSRCADLVPDTQQQDGVGMPGEGGWITGEDGDELEESEEEELGPGAGTVRPLENGDGEDDEDEAKWRRTDS